MIRSRPAANDDAARDRLDQLVQVKGEDYAGLSRMIGKPAGFLGRYVREGVPKRLGDHEASDLARYFGVEACELSAAWRA